MQIVHRPKRDRQLEKELADKRAMDGQAEFLTCRKCEHTGTDVHYQPYYDAVSKHDTEVPLCDDINACLDRSLPDWYRKNGA